ncbi:SocA family protein [Candidatus Falkowbacteria bacterium]|nr:SocA family protein [Candidatus Falkowbacteria bacterium]
MAINRKKYQNAILYLCQNLKGEVRGKKKLAKLLYFADFDFYEKTQKSITGDTYKALPMGPFPASLPDVTTDMTSKKMLSIEPTDEWNGFNPTEIYKCLVDPNVNIFSKDEIEILDRVIVKYGHLTGKQLEDLSHAEAPYIGTQPSKTIPYELALYRGTDFATV